MKFRKGDHVMFKYTPSRLNPPQELSGRSTIQKVVRQRNVAIVRVWNGSVLCPVKDQYEDVEIPLHKMRKYTIR